MKYLSHSITLVALVVLVVLPVIASAQETGFRQIVGIPGVDANASTQDYINALFALSIGVASALAVIRIIMAGVKYMFSEIVTDKSEAKKDIRNALIGLLLILGSVTILNEINPELTKFDIFRNAPAVQVQVDQNLGANPGDSISNDSDAEKIRSFNQKCQGGSNKIIIQGNERRCVKHEMDQDTQEIFDEAAA